MGRTPRQPKSKDTGYDWTPGGTTFEGEEVAQNLTFAPWKPEIGEKRTFFFLGCRKAMSDEFEREFTIYQGQDSKTGEFFSFVPGGLFDKIAHDANITAGMHLGVQFTGQIQHPKNPKQRVNQWIIVRLKDRKIDPTAPEVGKE